MWQELKSRGIAVKESLIAKHVVDTSYQQLLNLSQNALTEDESDLMVKGPSYVPLPKSFD